jgi:hypothetical protein
MTFHSEKSYEIKDGQYLGIACLLAAAIILPIIVFGIPSGNDLPQHFQFANAYYDSIISGDGFPNWSSRENAGYGSVGIRFYPPLSYYVLALARIVAGNWFDAAWIAFMFWMVLGCAGVYFWARWWLQPRDSAIAAVSYILFPYHLNQLYIAFIYADFAAAAILPFCFGFLTRIIDRGKKTDILGLAVAYAALVLTHLPTTIIGSMCLGFYALVLIARRRAFVQAIKAGIAIVLGLAASSYYWTRMISEMGWLNHATDKYSSGHYYYGNRFFPNSIYHIATDYRDNMVLSDILTVLSLLFFVTALTYLVYKGRNKTEASRESLLFSAVLPLAGFAFFMTTPLSSPVWAAIEPLQKTQFPARWMTVVAVCGAMIVGASAHFLLKGQFLKKRSWIYASVLFVSLFVIIDSAYFLYPSAFVPIARDKFETQIRELPEKENYQFWWSIWSNPEALRITNKVVADGRRPTVVTWKPEERTFTTEAGEAGYARVATFWYPRWQAEVNGVSVEVARDENGAILIPIPAEKATVRLWFQETPAFLLASIISAAMWFLMLTTIVFYAGRSKLRLKRAQPSLAEEEYSV